MEEQLVALNQDEGGFEAAEDGLEANIPIYPEEEEHNAKESINVDKGDDFPCFGQSQDNASGEEIVYEFKDCDAAFECVATEATSSSEPAPVGVSPAGTIKTMAALCFWSKLGFLRFPTSQVLGWGCTLPPNAGKFATLVQLASNQPEGVGVTLKKRSLCLPAGHCWNACFGVGKSIWPRIPRVLFRLEKSSF